MSVTKIRPKILSGNRANPGTLPARKKKEESIADKLKKLAAKEIIVNQNGSAVAMTQENTMLQAVFTKAMKGDLASAKFVTEQLGLKPSDMSQPTHLVPTEADLAILETHADWVGLVEQAKTDIENAAAPDTMKDGDDHDTDF